MHPGCCLRPHPLTHSLIHSFGKQIGLHSSQQIGMGIKKEAARIAMFSFFLFLAVPCGVWDLGSPAGIEPALPAVEAWNPNHWTAREVPKDSNVNNNILFYFRASQMALVVKNLPANSGDMRYEFDPWIGKIPWRRPQQPTPVFSLGESHGQKSLVGYSHRITEN